MTQFSCQGTPIRGNADEKTGFDGGIISVVIAFILRGGGGGVRHFGFATGFTAIAEKGEAGTALSRPGLNSGVSRANE